MNRLSSPIASSGAVNNGVEGCVCDGDVAFATPVQQHASHQRRQYHQPHNDTHNDRPRDGRSGRHSRGRRRGCGSGGDQCRRQQWRKSRGRPPPAARNHSRNCIETVASCTSSPLYVASVGLGGHLPHQYVEQIFWESDDSVARQTIDGTIVAPNRQPVGGRENPKLRGVCILKQNQGEKKTLLFVLLHHHHLPVRYARNGARANRAKQMLHAKSWRPAR